MSDTSTSGAGGAAPGWYADPYNPQQLRWWSGTTWTDHVSPAAAPAAAAEAAAQPAAQEPVVQEPAVQQPAVQQPVVQQPVVQEPAVQQPAVQQPVFQQPVVQQPVVEQPAAQQPVQDAGFPEDSLPSRRALRDAAAEPAQEYSAPAAAAPVAAAPAAAQPVTAQPVTPEPVAPSAWNQPSLQPTESYQAPVQNAWNQPVQDEQPAQPVQAAQPGYTEAPAAEAPAWGAPADSAPQSFQIPPAYQAPGTAPAQPAAPASGLDSLFGAPATASAPLAPADIAPAAPATSTPAEEPASADGSQWGLVASGRRDRAAAKPSSSSTAWVWIIAISPLLAAGAVGYLLHTNGNVFDTSNWMFLAALAAPYLLVVLFAVADRSRLAALGHENPASWTWAALTAPVYLIARAGVIRREMGGGGVPLIVWAICIVLSIVGFLGFGLVTHEPLLAGLPG